MTVAAGVVAGAGGLLTTVLGKTAGLETVDGATGFGCVATADDAIGGMALVEVDPTAVADGGAPLAAVVGSEFGTRFATGAVTELEAGVFLVGAGTAAERATPGPFDTVRTGMDGSTVVVALPEPFASLAT